MHAPGGRDPGARGDPLPVGLERQAELVVIHSQVAVSAAHNCFRHDVLNFLRQDTDIRLVGTIVGKPVEAKAVVETTEKNDIVLERHIGPAPAAPTATSASDTATSHPTARCSKAKTSAGTASNA